MKSREMYHRCEWCDALIREVSPPTKEQYNASMISIDEGTLLIPDAVVERLEQECAKQHVSVSHAASIAGHYCGPSCLIAKINSIITGRTGRAFLEER